MNTITILVENNASEPLIAEHGLSLFIETREHRILYDTGASKALLPNAKALNVDLDSSTLIYLSHSHYDHTGGIAHLKPTVPIYVGKGFANLCFSVHEDGSVHAIGVPFESGSVINQSNTHVLSAPTEIANGVYSTGPIPRNFPSQSHGKFYSSPMCTAEHKTNIPEEQSMLLADGTLITGCCHAGVQNTVEACQKAFPNIPIKRIIGGLHLAKASPTGLETVVSYLKKLKLEELILLHCTGDSAKEFLAQRLNCPVKFGKAGDRFYYP